METNNLNNQVNVRLITPADLVCFKQMLLEFYIEINHQFDSENLDTIIDNFSKKGFIFLAIDENSNQIIGFLCAIESNAIYANGNFGVINELFVSKEFRSNKVGQMFINFIVEFAKNKGWSRIELDTPEIEKSQKTINFYRKQQFVEIGLRMKKTIK